MPPWAAVVVAACAIALTVALIAMVLAVRRVVQRTDAVLGIVEQELRPFIAQAHALTDELRALTHEASLEMKRVGETTERVNAAVEGIGRIVHAVAALTRVGQFIGVAAGLKRGVDVFVQRYRK